MGRLALLLEQGCATSSDMERIGIRELRQNASEYVRRTEGGEALEVTDRGRPVARLSPLPRPGSTLAQLIAHGKATAPRSEILAVRPPPAPTAGARSLSEVVDDAILEVAVRLDPPALRTLDAIHIATCLQLAADLDAIVTYDRRMIEAAHLLALPAVSPARH